MNGDFDYREVPYNWLLCYVSECERKTDCMRYQVCRRMPEGITSHFCVLPTTMQHQQCPHFRPIQKLCVAIGFQGIFEEVKAKDLAPMRAELTAYLGNRTAFYRYRGGELPLMPVQQEWIRQMFRRYGYAEEVKFDATKDIYVFK